MITWNDVIYVLTNQTNLTTLQSLYMELAVDVMDGDGLNNKVYHECLPKKSKVMEY